MASGRKIEVTKVSQRLSKLEIMKEIVEETKGARHYMSWFKKTGNRKFFEMAQDEKKHAKMLSQMLQKYH